MRLNKNDRIRVYLGDNTDCVSWVGTVMAVDGDNVSVFFYHYNEPESIPEGGIVLQYTLGDDGRLYYNGFNQALRVFELIPGE